MKKLKVMSIFGTRPEAIKMAPVIQQIEREPTLENVIVVSAQHREMLDQVLHIFKIQPDFDLNIMKQSQTLTDITVNVLTEMNSVFEQVCPDIVLVHGDTSTTFAASLSAFYHQIPVGHVEAGLRTWNKQSPFPEELNRQVTDDIADLYFAPTKLSAANLRKENHAAEHIFITGNTAIDALKETVSKDYQHDVLSQINPQHRIILVTMHRRENQGAPMARTFQAIRDVVDHNDDVEIIFPVHLNPRVQQTADQILGDDPKIHLIDPLDVVDFHNLAARSYFIMTDSGGVQEEAPSLGKPVLVLRDTTERPEGIEAGTLKLVGTDPQIITQTMQALLTDDHLYQAMATAKNPYGDGFAAQHIIEAIKYHFKITATLPPLFK